MRIFCQTGHNVKSSFLDIKTCNIHLYVDDTVMYAIVPTVGQAFLELQSDLVTLLNALVGLKCVLN